MPLPEIWTSRQRVMILCLLAGLCAWATWQWIAQPVDVDQAGNHSMAEVSQAEGSLTHRPPIDGRINPNTAEVWELAALPSVGPTRAQAIVNYRNQWMKDHAGQVPFGRPEDLQQVKGLGPGIVQQIGPYLKFGQENTHSPATAPAMIPSR